MNGPDLSHLLDGDGSDRPSPDVLAGIVLRHRRQRIKRARTAATLGIVLALAGVGVGIGLSRQGSTVTASPPLTPGVGKVGSGATSTTGLLPAAPGSAPAGLGWVGVSALSSSELAPTAFGLANRLNPAGNLQASGAYSAVSPGLGALCSIFSCPPGEPGDSV
ncbi:MAG TPA: hypothetical protein VK217_01600, partial [Acidimicrobiales bacterium]|nr:hypothetical protein [Acidimicrobiales bacterium]